MSVLSPFVYWAQSESHIFIKVDLKDVKEPDFELVENKLIFKTQGVGAQGLRNYQFSLDFYQDIATKDSTLNVWENRVELNLPKSEKSWWPRLISQPQKPAWLKIDYDRFQSEDMVDEKEEVNDIRRDYADIYNQLQKEEIGYRKEQFKMVYLILYNLFMYVGFMYVITVLIMRYVKEGPDSFSGTYQSVGHAMCFLHLLQCLEILHPVFGYTKGSFWIPLIQIGGRNIILFAILEQEPRIQVMPVVFYLFMTWSTIEVVRYPYYMSQLIKKENGLLTWLRYSIWMICYPIGFTCEGVIIFRDVIFLDQSLKFSIILPYLNLRFGLATIGKVYLLFVMLPTMYILMSHLYKARKQKLGPKTKIKAKKVK